MLCLDDFTIASHSDKLDELVLFEGVLPDWGECNYLGVTIGGAVVMGGDASLA